MTHSAGIRECAKKSGFVFSKVAREGDDTGRRHASGGGLELAAKTPVHRSQDLYKLGKELINKENPGKAGDSGMGC